MRKIARIRFWIEIFGRIRIRVQWIRIRNTGLSISNFSHVCYLVVYLPFIKKLCDDVIYKTCIFFLLGKFCSRLDHHWRRSQQSHCLNYQILYHREYVQLYCIISLFCRQEQYRYHIKVYYCILIRIRPSGWEACWVVKHYKLSWTIACVVQYCTCSSWQA